MDEQPLNPQQPPSEKWWERELHRKEKMLDQFIGSLEDADELTEESLNAVLEEFDAIETGIENDSTGEQPGALDDETPSPDEPENEECSEENENFPILRRQACDFAVRIMQLENLPDDSSILLLSAGRIGANLAGGHGLGYEEFTLCGNIVKCRWALSDCEFCEQMLEFMQKQKPQAAMPELIQECQSLAKAIRARIEKLRARVWWPNN